MPNPFQKWLNADGGGSLGSCVASVTPQDICWREKFFSRIWAQVVAAQEWTGVFWRFVVTKVQERFDAWEVIGQRLAHKVLVMWCYSGSTEPIATIVGLIPPTTVMFEQKWPKGKGKGRPRHNGKKTGDLLHELQTFLIIGGLKQKTVSAGIITEQKSK